MNYGVPMDNFGVPMDNFGMCFPGRCGCPRSSGLRDRETPEVIGPLPLDIPLLREKPGGAGFSEISKVGERPETFGKSPGEIEKRRRS